ncbi:MAG: hypothetical protein AAF721_37645 [Myxococcota bacterium]
MRRSTRLLATIVIALTASACAGEDGPPADKDSARAGWRSTQMALGEAGVQAGWAASGNIDADSVTGMVTGTVACDEGGSLTLSADGEVSNTETAGSVSIAFDGCEVDGVTIDGTLDYAGSVTQTEVTASIYGDLTWSGNATGHCAIELEARVATNGTMVSASSTGGSMCGYELAEVFGG